MKIVVVKDHPYDLKGLVNHHVFDATKMPVALAQKIIEEHRRHIQYLGFHVDFGWFLLGMDGDDQLEMLWCEAEWKRPEPTWKPWPDESGYWWWRTKRITSPNLIKVDLFNASLATRNEYDFTYYLPGNDTVFYGNDLYEDDDEYEFYGPIPMPGV